MVSKIQNFTISAGGRIAVVASRSNPSAAVVMAPACCDALEATGVESDDIFLIDAPSDSVLPGVARELARSGFFVAVIALAVLPSGEAMAESVLNGMSSSDFFVPVIPGMVIGEHDAKALARAGQDAGRAAIELVNLAGVVQEMRELAEATMIAEAEAVEEVAEAGPGRRRRAASATTARKATTRGRKKARTAKAKPARSGRATRKSAESMADNGAAPKRRGRPRKAGA